MMTTMAALLGGLPLALGTGTGSELRRPLGITIVGGLIMSQALIFYCAGNLFVSRQDAVAVWNQAPPARCETTFPRPSGAD